MKRKLILVSNAILLLLFVTIAACSKKDFNPILRATLNGVEMETDDFDPEAYQYLDSEKAISVSGILNKDKRVISIKMRGIEPGTYIGFDNNNVRALISVGTASGYYVSDSIGGRAIITLTKNDNVNRAVEGTFSGTVVSVDNPADSIKITKGIFRSVYQ